MRGKITLRAAAIYIKCRTGFLKHEVTVTFSVVSNCYLECGGHVLYFE